MTEVDTSETSPATPSDTPPTDVSAELAKSDDISLYVEDRADQEQAEETGQPAKKASRYERLKRARDAYKAEAEDLRKRLGQEPEPQEQPEYPYEAEIEQGRAEAEFADQMAARDNQVARQTELRLRAEAFAQTVPDFHETIESVRDIFELPPTLTELMMQSPHGPAMAYCLAKDAWSEDSQQILAHFETIKDNPLEQARQFGQMEQAFRNRQQAAPPRVTQAPPPMRPVAGGATARKDLHSLAVKDDISDYAKARRNA